ncbi:biotin--[acetyl-CoA-carboxylase] ligase [Leucobacter sp. USHLN153]|uniref:biotin--[acetyl-CoA-carboxylase] ligase n=1 Tax=Leucobacter sp. USHLN153 TaxID=3081268 RepID=UPI0030194787
MHLPRSRARLPEVIWRDSSPSTNAELRELVRSRPDLPNGTLLVTSDQTAGRGRLDRGWAMPPDTSLATSVLVRGFGAGGLAPSWLPLLAGSALATALQPHFTAAAGAISESGGGSAGAEFGDSAMAGEAKRVGVKWPNDVHVRDEEDAIAGRPGKKLCGLLCEMLPSDGVRASGAAHVSTGAAAGAAAEAGRTIIVGAGINLLIPEWDLPTERAGSLLSEGADVGGAETLADPVGQELADRVLADYVAELLRLAALAAANPAAARARVARHSLTLGTEVRVHLPGDEIVDGRAARLAEDGSLVVDLPTGGDLTVSAGDIEHLR